MRERNTYLIQGRNSIESWERAIKLISQQTEIISGDNFLGNAALTRDACFLITLDEEAVEDIVDCKVHPAFETKRLALEEYANEFTYKYTKESWTLPSYKKFIYSYFDRFCNYPLPNIFIYQGDFCKLNIPEKYFTRDINGGLTGGLDQVLLMHDSIRSEGISRRHQIITFIPGIDNFLEDIPCLQRLWVRVLVPKSEWKHYKYCIPVEVAVIYRSWDFGRALPSNLYGIITMLYRYILGNLNEQNEISGENIIDFKIHSLKLYCNSGHLYCDNYDIVNKLKTKETYDVNDKIKLC